MKTFRFVLLGVVVAALALSLFMVPSAVVFAQTSQSGRADTYIPSFNFMNTAGSNPGGVRFFVGTNDGILEFWIPIPGATTEPKAFKAEDFDRAQVNVALNGGTVTETNPTNGTVVTITKGSQPGTIIVTIRDRNGNLLLLAEMKPY